MLDFLYEPYEDERQTFGSHWCGPTVYKHCEEVLVALYYADEGGDGQNVEVHCTAAPARFYTLKVIPGFNSIGEPKAGYEVHLGSGQAELAVQLAELITDGMLGFGPLQIEG